jgi:hypothetical protein
MSSGQAHFVVTCDYVFRTAHLPLEIGRQAPVDSRIARMLFGNERFPASRIRAFPPANLNRRAFESLSRAHFRAAFWALHVLTP